MTSMLSDDETLLSIIKNPHPLWAVFASDVAKGDIWIDEVPFLALIKNDRRNYMYLQPILADDGATGGFIRVPERIRGYIDMIEGELPDGLKAYVSRSTEVVSLEELKKEASNHRIHRESNE